MGSDLGGKDERIDDLAATVDARDDRIADLGARLAALDATVTPDGDATAETGDD